MTDWSVSCTPRRAGTVDVDTTLHARGYRDCALEAVRYLTHHTQYGPDSALVRGILSLLDRSTATGHVAAGRAADINVCSRTRNVQRVRWTTERVEGVENQLLTVRRRRIHRRQCRRQRAPTAAVADVPDTSPTLPDCEAATSRDGRSIAATDGEEQHRYALRTLPASSRPSWTRGAAGDDECHSATMSDVAECSSLLLDLSQTDVRIRNVLTELLQLMDTDDASHF